MGRLMRRRRERGAVAVEAAIILPLLIVLVFGTIEVTLLLRDYIAAVSASRGAARVASAESRLDGFVQDAVNSIERSASTLAPDTIESIWVYEANALGFPGSQNSFERCDDTVTNCVRYGWEDDDGAGPLPGAVVYQDGSWDPTAINACLADPAIDSVGVYVQARHDWVVGFFPGSGSTVTASTVMRFEPVRFPPKPGESNPNLLNCRQP